MRFFFFDLEPLLALQLGATLIVILLGAIFDWRLTDKGRTYDYYKMAIYSKVIVQIMEADNREIAFRSEFEGCWDSVERHPLREGKPEKFLILLLMTFAIIFLAPFFLILYLYIIYDERDYSRHVRGPSFRSEEIYMSLALAIGLLGYIFIGSYVLSLFFGSNGLWALISIILAGIVIAMFITGFLLTVSHQIQWKDFWKEQLLEAMKIAVTNESSHLLTQATLFYNEVDQAPNFLVVKELTILGVLFGVVQGLLLYFPL